MAWLAVHKNGNESISPYIPTRWMDEWVDMEDMGEDEWAIDKSIALPRGSIFKLTGRELTWDDEPIELK